MKEDSIAKAEQDKVIGEITFGVSEKEFEKRRNEFLKQTEYIEVVTVSGYEFKGNRIGSYRFDRLQGRYHNDNLYFTRIIGSSIHYEKYDSELKPEAQSIYNIFTKDKYGLPSEENIIPEWHRLQKGYYYTFAIWEVGTKTIKLSIQDNGIYHKINVDIFRPEIENFLKNIEENKMQDAERRATDLI